jgi:tRNA threonylcarbamoyl adenosine modification protein YeaZ
MYTLILDTSTELCTVGIAVGSELATQEVFPHKNQLSETLLLTIQAMVEKVCGSPKNLHIIAFGNGPGSYTGTRLGAAVAKTLAFGLEVPIKAFPSPLAFLPEREGSFAFVVPARSGQLYALTGAIENGCVVRENAVWVDPEELEDADFLICASPEKLPGKTCLSPAPNLNILSKWLFEKQPTEQVDLVYLGTP